MKILMVEDDAHFIEALETIIRSQVAKPEITVAKERQEALTRVQSEFFDLIVLDLNIPPDANGGVGDPTHGHSVFTTARVCASGTPIIVLTGSSAEEFLPSLLRHQQQTDVWGAGRLSLVSFHKKHLLDSFPGVLQEYVTHFQFLAGIELDRGSLIFSAEEDRRFRIFARANNAARVVVRQVGGGLSATRVYKVVLSNSTGAITHNVIAKIGSADDVASEDQRYSNHIARLAPQSTPRKFGIYEHGAKVTSGVFYGLATGYDFNAWSHNVLSSQLLTQLLENHLAPWKEAAESRLTIETVRQRLLSDADFSKVTSTFALDWCAEFEGRQIQVKWSCCHGDLHGLNVLCTEQGQPILIDYGDVGPGPACTDPLTLELSMFFHPEGPLVESVWPNATEAASWGDIETYLRGSPYPDIVRNCRSWAHKSAAGKREISAVAYSYLLRQLKYDNTNKDRALALLQGVRNYFNDET